MDTWRAHMPLGLFLKSEPYGSAISAPARGYDIATYARLHGFDDYVDRVGPLSLERFLGYADWFTEQLVPDIRDVTVTNVVPSGDGFKVEFADEVPAFVRQVIIATGVLPYAHIPDELSALPDDLMTHSAVHDRLDQFHGKRVAVIGGGQSALQTAALLHEKGVDVARLYGRDPEDGVGGDGAFFLLLDEPEVYGLPPDPVVTTRDLGSIWKHVGLAAATLVGLGAASFVGKRR